MSQKSADLYLRFFIQHIMKYEKLKSIHAKKYTGCFKTTKEKENTAILQENCDTER
jgi:hypothetical protein